MKKRLTCLLLALVMVISLIPAGIITASAASLSISSAGLKLIKSYVGFHAYAYETYTGSGVWKVGYGTTGVKGQVITEANADTELRAVLKTYETGINAALGSNALQKRYDALAWCMYIEGSIPTGLDYSLSTGRSTFVDAMVQGAGTGNDYSAGYPGTAVAQSIVVRRLAMANLYLNGNYSVTTGSLGYVLFNAGEGQFAPNQKLRVRAFDGSEGTQIPVMTVTYAGHTFLGWYNGTALVTGMSSAINGATLYARWQETDKVASSYSLPGYYIYKASGLADDATCIVRADHSDSAAQVDTISRDSVVYVANEYIDSSNYKWIELATGGWVKLNLMGTALPVLVNAVTVTITDDIVNIRKDPGFDKEKVGTASRNQTKTIVMVDSSGDWGYCSEGWIYLPYTNYSGKIGAATTTGSGTPGVVTGATRVNVRHGAGTAYPIATTLAEGTSVKVYEQTTVNGAPWGRIDQGWIAMQYVRLSAEATTGANITIGTTVYVSSSVNLNVRTGPGTQYSKVAALAPGTAAVIYQKQVVNGVSWGLTDQGWINLSYVTAAASSGSGTVAVSGISGTVVNCTKVNVRAAAGTSSAPVGTKAAGTRVVVTERTMVNGHYWGHVDTGWVCMDYIQLDSEWKDPAAVTTEQINNTVSSFTGYPVTAIVNAPLYATASSDAKVSMTMAVNSCFTVSAFQVNGTKTFGKAMVNGVFRGWVDMTNVKMDAFNAKVTAEKANAYEEPSTRSTFYAALVKGTAITVASGEFNKAGGWVLDNGILWGKIEVSGHACWIQMSNVTMFLNNTTPTGETTLSGVGYLTGKINAATADLYKDENGNVSSTTTIYSLVKDQVVNIEARQLTSTGTYAKITVGSVTGWVDMSKITLNPVEMKTVSTLDYYSDSALTTLVGSYNAGIKVTVVDRTLAPFTNGIVKKMDDIGKVYFEDDVANTYYVRLDSGKLSYASAAATTTANPNIGISVAVTGKISAATYIYADVSTSSEKLLQLNAGIEVTAMNWLNVGTETWCKVQAGTIVGWVPKTSIDFSGLKGTVAVQDLPLYALADKDSAVQILNCNNRQVDVTNLTFDGTTLWGQVDIAGKIGYVDVKNLTLNTPGMSDTTNIVTGPTIATAKVNSHNITVGIGDSAGSMTGSEISSIPKGTVLNLQKVEVNAGKAWWYASFGDNDWLASYPHDKNGWIEMSNLSINAVSATVSSASIYVYADLSLADDIYTLYRNEQVAVGELAMSNSGTYLCGEVTVNGETGWIIIADSTGAQVGLKPGSTQTAASTASSASTSASTSTAATTSTGTAGYITGAASVNVRSYAGIAPDNIVTSLPNGTAVTVTETTNVNGKTWGKIAQGWVCMDYVRTGTATTVTTGTATIAQPTIMTTVPSGAIAVGYAARELTIYGGAGFGYGSVGSVPKNGAVVIYENCLSGGVSWGRTDKGWVILSYVTLTGIGTEGSGSMGNIGRTGSAAKVRSTANGLELTSVMVSSRVAILETSGNWGRTAIGWICMDYVVLASDLPAGASMTGSTTATEAATTPTESAEEVG